MSTIQCLNDNENIIEESISTTDLEIKNKEVDDYDELIKKLVKVIKNLRDEDNVMYQKHYVMYDPRKSHCSFRLSKRFDVQTPFIDKYSVFQCIYQKMFMLTTDFEKDDKDYGDEYIGIPASYDEYIKKNKYINIFNKYGFVEHIVDIYYEFVCQSNDSTFITIGRLKVNNDYIYFYIDGEEGSYYYVPFKIYLSNDLHTLLRLKVDSDDLYAFASIYNLYKRPEWMIHVGEMYDLSYCSSYNLLCNTDKLRALKDYNLFKKKFIENIYHKKERKKSVTKKSLTYNLCEKPAFVKEQKETTLPKMSKIPEIPTGKLNWSKLFK